MYLFTNTMPSPGGFANPDAPADPGLQTLLAVDSSHVMVRDMTWDFDLYEKDPDTVASGSPGSLVKLMTALILVERKGPGGDGLLTTQNATVSALAGDLVGGTTANIGNNDVLTLEHLLYGMMVPSGNDAAMVIARIIGTEIFVAAGSTGNTGVTRFVEEMNARATTLGLVDTVFVNPYGAASPDNNLTTAREMAILATAAFSDPIIRTVSGTATHTMVVTGANARTYDVDHTSQMIDDDGFVASKTGWPGTASNNYAQCLLWQAPAGSLILVVTIDATANGNRYLDARSILYQIVEDIAYTVDGVGIGTDPDIASVVLLAGFEGSIVDESPVGRTLTAQGNAQASSASPLVGTESLLLDGTGDYVETPDTADLSFGSADWTVEFYFSGAGSEPGGNVAFVSKWDTTGNQREWSVQYSPSTNTLVCFVSTTGADFPESNFDLDTFEMTAAAFFNGGKRHILARRDGNEISVYINGVKGAVNHNISTTALFAGAARCMIGARDAGASFEFAIAGTIDEVRVTGGVSRTTSDKFTPTGRAYPRS